MPHTPDVAETEAVARWASRLKLAERYQDQDGNQDDRWERNVRALAGDFGSLDQLGPDAVDVNLVYSTARTALPPLWLADPHLSVRPRVERFKEADNVLRAERTELELNYWLRELEVRRRVIRQAVLDAEATNHAYAYLGYVREEQEVGAPGERHEPNPLVRLGQPFILRLSPRQVLVPPGYSELELCPWLAIVWVRTVGQVKARYGDRAEEVKPSRQMEITAGISEQAALAGEEGDELGLVDVVNVWDKTTGELLTFALKQPAIGWLEAPAAWPFAIEGFPVAHMRFVDIPDEYWGTPPISYYYQQNKELNANRTAMSRRMRKTKQAVFADSSAPQELAEAYKQAGDGEIIGADFGGEDIRQKLMPMQILQLDESALAYDSVVKSDFLNVSGLGAEQRGGGDPNIRSATASQNVEKHAQVRASEKGDRVAGFWIDIGRKLWMILKNFPDEERTRRIVGPRLGQFREVTYTLADLEGEFDFEMDFSAALADNPATRQTQALLNYNLLRGDPLIDPERLVRDVLATQNKANPDAYMLFLRQPDQELQLMLQGMPVEPHERDDHMQHLQMHDQQGEQIDQQLQQAALAGQPQPGMQMAQVLLIAHVQAHVALVQRIEGVQGRQGPIAENMLRNQTRVVSGGETNAEITGQPLTESNLVQ